MRAEDSQRPDQTCKVRIFNHASQDVRIALCILSLFPRIESFGVIRYLGYDKVQVNPPEEKLAGDA